VAIAAYAAAPIAQANPLLTAFQALRLSFVGFIIPFVLIYNPSLSLVFEFEIIAFISVLIRLSLAIWLMTTSLGGVDRDRLSIISRVLRMALGITVLLNFIEVQVIGVIAALALLYLDAQKAKKEAAI
jgi:TRAP-type uncharacterized transport system fused permease subunit